MPDRAKRNVRRKQKRGTPTESDRQVLERAEQPTAADVPEVANVGGGEKIEPVDLSLHGDGINHWQDELPSRRNERRAREGKIPSRKKKG
ncbi:hypothetical protein [Nitratireductor sp. GCM10026969]|uniref:hypothetical protein n=1 Tax=Nitratireductor sp. GCM10026969 TaxID=3252645 RepID=UPI003615194B